MFNVGLGEIAAILVLGLLIFGPDRLPQAVQTVARGMRRFRSAADDATRSLQDAAGWDSAATRQTLTDIADLHPRRLAGSLFEEPQSGATPSDVAQRRAPVGQRPAEQGSKPGAPGVAFDPDAP